MREARGALGRLRASLATLRRLRWSERRLLLDAAIAMTAINLALRVATFQRVHEVLRRLAGRRGVSVESHGAVAAAPAANVARLVNMASRHTPLHNSCLHRSLALWWLLERRGFDSRLQFGARRRAGGFEAHAWVECGGTILSDDPSDHDYARLAWAPLKNGA